MHGLIVKLNEPYHKPIQKSTGEASSYELEIIVELCDESKVIM